MSFSIQNRQRAVPINTKLIKQRVQRLMTYLSCEHQELSIVFASDRFMQVLNRTYRQQDRPTNVLAFPQPPLDHDEPTPPLLGDVIISLPTAAREANDLHQAVETRVFYLILHGLLHLLGFDHEQSDDERHRMEKHEQEILRYFDKNH